MGSKRWVLQDATAGIQYVDYKHVTVHSSSFAADIQENKDAVTAAGAAALLVALLKTIQPTVQAADTLMSLKTYAILQPALSLTRMPSLQQALCLCWCPVELRTATCAGASSKGFAQSCIFLPASRCRLCSRCPASASLTC